MLFFSPSYIKEGRQFVKDARKLIAYKRDIVPSETIAGVEREIDLLQQAMALRDATSVKRQMQRLDEACGTLTKPHPDAVWRENVEVFLVAIVIALAVRTYFLQPFTIPTGSMQPTLNGIIATRTEAQPPNVVQQAFEFAVFGRNYLNVVAKQDETVVSVEEENRGGFRKLLSYVRIDTDKGNTYWAWGAKDPINKAWGTRRGSFPPTLTDVHFKAGEPIIRGYLDTGDHVFVDKVSYHFRRPANDEVFVFSTAGIMPQATQYYIKRLAGTPGQTLRIDPPRLFINDQVPTNFGYNRVMSGTFEQPNKGYRGYSNSFEYGGSRTTFLNSPEDRFTIPDDAYFAMGDNSYNSSDSRVWGTVPKQNVMGRAVFVYWPFNSHWSFIR